MIRCFYLAIFGGKAKTAIVVETGYARNCRLVKRMRAIDGHVKSRRISTKLFVNKNVDKQSDKRVGRHCCARRFFASRVWRNENRLIVRHNGTGLNFAP